MSWREDFELETGDRIEIDGRTLELVDLPTDGPLFRDVDEVDPDFEMVQMTVDEFEEATDE